VTHEPCHEAKSISRIRQFVVAGCSRLPWRNNPQRLRDTRRLIGWNHTVAPVCSFSCVPALSALFDHPEAQADRRLNRWSADRQTIAETVNAAPASHGCNTREVLD